MNTDITPTTTVTDPVSLPTCTAFLQGCQVAQGAYDHVAAELARLDLSGGGLLVFDDATCGLIDHPWPPGFVLTPPQGRPSTASVAPPAEPPSGPSSVGRPKLGVVAREVTLLPAHWAWLGAQRGGASAALRRLVHEAMQVSDQRETVRQAKERAYRFMSPMASEWAGFEEASRALFAQDAAVFAERIAHWPADVQSHLAWLTKDAWR